MQSHPQHFCVPRSSQVQTEQWPLSLQRQQQSSAAFLLLQHLQAATLKVNCIYITLQASLPSWVFFLKHACCSGSKVTYCTSKGRHGRTQTVCWWAGTRLLSIHAPGSISLATTTTLSSVCMFLSPFFKITKQRSQPLPSQDSVSCM